MRKSFVLALLCAFHGTVHAANFSISQGSFLLDSKPLQIRSGEIHYSRVPREEWGSRIHMAKAMGLNTICTYVFWNLHEQKRGEYDFSGDKDITASSRSAGRKGCM